MINYFHIHKRHIFINLFQAIEFVNPSMFYIIIHGSHDIIMNAAPVPFHEYVTHTTILLVQDASYLTIRFDVLYWSLPLHVIFQIRGCSYCF